MWLVEEENLLQDHLLQVEQLFQEALEVSLRGAQQSSL